MKTKLVLLALILTALITGCGIKWKTCLPEPDFAKDGWEIKYYTYISDCEFIISIGQKNQFPKIKIFCSYGFYGTTWEKVYCEIVNNEIRGFYFVKKVQKNFMLTKEEAKHWKKSPIRDLKKQENLSNLPEEIKNQVKKVIAYADRWYNINISYLK